MSSPLWLLWLFGDPHDCSSSQTIRLPCLPHQPWFLLLQIHQPYIRNVWEVWGDGSVGNVLAVQAGKPKFKPLESIYKKSGACNPRAGTVETRESLKFAGHPVYLNPLALGSVKYSAWPKNKVESNWVQHPLASVHTQEHISIKCLRKLQVHWPRTELFLSFHIYIIYILS